MHSNELLSHILITLMVFVLIFGIYLIVNDHLKVLKPIRRDRFPLPVFGLGGLGGLGGGVRPVINANNVNNANDQARVFMDIFIQEFEQAIPRHINVQPRMRADVHDHQIQGSVKIAISKLDQWYQGLETKITEQQVFDQIKEYIFNVHKGPVSHKEKAYSTIRTIEKVNGKLASVNKTEKQILMMVWERILINKDNADDIKSNLLELLADSAIQVDSPYCLVGRITRIIQSLQSLDKENIVNIRSTDTVKDELQTKIPLLRTQYFEEHTDQLKPYEEGDETITQDLRKYIKDELIKDYKDTDVMQKHEGIVDAHLDQL